MIVKKLNSVVEKNYKYGFPKTAILEYTLFSPTERFFFSPIDENIFYFLNKSLFMGDEILTFREKKDLNFFDS